MTTALLFFVLGLLGLALIIIAIQFAWNSKVKSKCTCGATAGRWINWYDEPVRLGGRWYAKRQYPRRWTDADFAKMSKLGRVRGTTNEPK